MNGDAVLSPSGPSGAGRPRARRHADLAAAALLAFLLLLFLVNLDTLPFYHEEPRRVVVAQEMLVSGNWVQPTIYGEPYFKKPPMQNWLIALASPGGRVTRVSGRLPSVLAVIGTGLVLYLLLRRRRPELALTAMLAGVANPLILFEYGAKVEPDLLLVFFTTLAWALWLRGPTRWWTVLLSGLALGCGVLTKGLSPLFFYPGILAAVITERRARGRRLLWLAPHLLATLLPAALWLLALSGQGGLERLLAVSGAEVAERAGATFGSFLLHLVAYPAEIAADLLPWTLALILAWRAAPERDLTYRTAFWIGLLSLLVFTVMPEARTRYLLPAFPMYGVLIAAHLRPALRVRPWLSRGVASLFALLAVGGTVFVLNAGLVVAGAQLLLVAFVAGGLALSRLRFTAAGLAAALVLLAFAAHRTAFLPLRALEEDNPRAVSAALVPHVDRDLPIVVDPAVSHKLGPWLEGWTGRLLLRPRHTEATSYNYLTYPGRLLPGEEILARVPHRTDPSRMVVLQRVLEGAPASTLPPFPAP